MSVPSDLRGSRLARVPWFDDAAGVMGSLCIG